MKVSYRVLKDGKKWWILFLTLTLTQSWLFSLWHPKRKRKKNEAMSELLMKLIGTLPKPFPWSALSKHQKKPNWFWKKLMKQEELVCIGNESQCQFHWKQENNSYNCSKPSTLSIYCWKHCQAKSVSSTFGNKECSYPMDVIQKHRTAHLYGVPWQWISKLLSILEGMSSLETMC